MVWQGTWNAISCNKTCFRIISSLLFFSFFLPFFFFFLSYLFLYSYSFITISQKEVWWSGHHSNTWYSIAPNPVSATNLIPLVILFFVNSFLLVYYHHYHYYYHYYHFYHYYHYYHYFLSYCHLIFINWYFALFYHYLHLCRSQLCEACSLWGLQWKRSNWRNIFYG